MEKQKHKHDSIRSDPKLNKINFTNNTFLYVLHFVAESKLVPRITEELTIAGNIFFYFFLFARSQATAEAAAAAAKITRFTSHSIE